MYISFLWTMIVLTIISLFYYALHFCCSQAIEIDFTDISVCYRLGLLALKVDHFLLASRAFQKVR